MCAQVNLLVQIKRSIQALLQSAFERYTNLCDSSASTSTACGGAEAQVGLGAPDGVRSCSMKAVHSESVAVEQETQIGSRWERVWR